MPANVLDAAVHEALRRDPRASTESLAREAGTTAAHVRRVLTGLVAAGMEVRGIVHPSVFGHGALAHLRIQVSGPSAPIADTIAARTDIPYLTRTSGRFALSAELRTGDRTALRTALADIRSIPGVTRLVVDEYLDLVKDAGVRPRPLGSESVDDIDLVILRELQADGRASFASLARAVSLTTTAARARVLRLLDAGIVTIGIRTRTRGTRVQHGFRARTDGSDATLEALQGSGDVVYLAAAIGDADIVGTLESDGLGASAETVERLRSTPGVLEVETWTHLDFVKERYAEAPAPDAFPHP